ncbi:MAG: hypothetical protein JNM43_19760 [Planctomycetaceae bacterium]|nr:hypothetical protein [Planctomycetaceae bacterium]
MTKEDGSNRIEELRRALSQAEPAAYLVAPRVIRRVIRERYGFAKLSASIPHTESQIVNASDLRHLVHADELGLATLQSLPDVCILITQPDEGELEHWPIQELLQQVWRRLFHAQIDRQLTQKLQHELRRADIQERIAKIGQVEFDEAHFVLRSELRLIDPMSRTEAWREFVALYLELKRFEPDLLPVWFPSLADRANVESILGQDVNAEELFLKTRLYGATSPDLTPHVVRDETRLVNTRRDWSLGVGITPSDRAYLRQLRWRDKANERGNTVGAIVCATRAAQRATSDEKRLAAQEKARADIRYLVDRLQRALNITDTESSEWQGSLWELANNAIQGFWNSEKKLLFDLQKVCLDHERVTYQVDLVKWIVSRGKRPLRRPLTSLREVRMAKHLASAANRLVYVRLSGDERERLSQLLHNAAHLSEMQLRDRMRPVVQKTLADVGLQPNNVPEQVASDKLVDDALDCIVDRGYLTMGYLRDAISKNDLKLPDLSDVRDLWRGDHLLRADDQLDVALDGVYRRGEFYLRWLQITSSLFFGTPAGRFTTLFLIIPFGGAVVVVEGVRHVLHMFHRKPAPATAEKSGTTNKTTESETQAPSASGTGLQVKTPEASLEAEEAVASALQDGTSLDLRSINVSEPILVELIQDEVAGPPAPANAQIANESGDGALEAAAPDSVSAPIEPKLILAADEKTDTLTESPKPLDEAKAQDKNLSEKTLVPPDDARDAIDQIVSNQVETVSWVIGIGFLLMALIHVVSFRKLFFRFLSESLKFIRKVVIDLPSAVLNLPVVQKVWRHRRFVKFRRVFATPALIGLATTRFLPWLISGNALGWWWMATITVLSSAALNSRLGRDAQELTAEWVGNAWYKLRARVVMAVIDWVIDFFRMLLNFLERFLYAVDEWLRFHSDESWASIVVKAVLGVVWSFVSFLIRIYVNLLIEPTFHPVKHFPVVTVAHKMILPGLIYLEGTMVGYLSAYLGTALARSFTWFNIFFIPGIFGFAVWELKENWRLYMANRKSQLTPVAVGSHGETVARLLRPGFHSGTLPKLFRRLRRLEHQEPSFKRFSARRAGRGQLEHVEMAIRNFVERELIRLLQLCPAWGSTGIECGRIHTASNSFVLDLVSPTLGEQPIRLLFQEQSGWVVASVAETGCLRFASADQLRSFQNALEGFYRKCGIDMVREQMEAKFLHGHQYDINWEGFAIWPHGMFSHELTVDLYRKGNLRPLPAAEAAAAGIQPVDRESVLFFETGTAWADWVQLWSQTPEHPQPLACRQLPAQNVLHPIR